MPAAAERAIENDPKRRILTILSMRGFARAKSAYETHDSRRGVWIPKNRTEELVQAIEFEEAGREMGLGED